jgi:hypothetical protein
LAGGPEQNVLYFGQDLTGANTAALFGKVTGERAAIYGEKAAPGVSSIQSTGGDMLRERFETLRREVASAQSGIPSDLPQLRLQTHQPVLWGTTSLSDVVSVFGQITNTTSNFPAIWGFHSGVGSAVNGQISNASSTAPAVWGVSNGTGSGVASTMTGNGSGLLVDHNGSSGNLALFRSGNANQVRIDKTGKGFFNGGTQTGGADVAEAFEVEGFVDEYEPGDVMVISTDNDRTMEKSREPYSTLVAGVYATKPGVLLTERNVDDPHDDTVPLGVIGVIPTKVSGENGPIRRGDLLVTANLPGHAMKGTDRERLVGAVLGKALENFDGCVGVIRVLVNTK